MLYLDCYGGTDPLGMFPLFLKRTADVMAPRLSVVFRRIVRLGSFPPCWRQANVTPIPKCPPPSSVANYRPISITPALSKVFERLVSSRLGRFMERNGVLPTTQFAYRKDLGTCSALLCVSHHCKVNWRVGRRLGSCRLISVQPLIGLTIWAFSKQRTSAVRFCLAAEPHKTTGIVYPSQCLSGTILLTPYSTVWNRRVSRPGPMLFYWPLLLYPYYSRLLYFPFSSFCL